MLFMQAGENSDIAFFPPTNKGHGSSNPGNRRNDENGGCHPSKMTVCQKHRFDNPERTEVLLSGPAVESSIEDAVENRGL